MTVHADKENAPALAVEEDENADEDAEAEEAAAAEATEAALTETARSPPRALLGKKRKGAGSSKVRD